MTFATVVFAIWGGTNLWLAGYEQGYEAGEDSAWTRANSMPLSAVSGRVEFKTTDESPESFRLISNSTESN
ncbi:hypothetical protein [Rubinisphaera margarita]|uniref:hypothetical protein n=1 Tax=Rubinisphaera margarita TaxID=2909586 RepID=UPI001EE8BBC1|nr:hypothetical protein [Rubinisphaera margarita]MCG6155198.1 hypothetical protein [Rubinisphaera margarita]